MVSDVIRRLISSGYDTGSVLKDLVPMTTGGGGAEEMDDDVTDGGCDIVSVTGSGDHNEPPPISCTEEEGLFSMEGGIDEQALTPIAIVTTDFIEDVSVDQDMPTLDTPPLVTPTDFTKVSPITEVSPINAPPTEVSPINALPTESLPIACAPPVPLSNGNTSLESSQPALDDTDSGLSVTSHTPTSPASIPLTLRMSKATPSEDNNDDVVAVRKKKTRSKKSFKRKKSTGMELKSSHISWHVLFLH